MDKKRCRACGQGLPEPKCKTCKDTGRIGTGRLREIRPDGTWGGNFYYEPCPDCDATPPAPRSKSQERRLAAQGEEEDG